MEDLKGKLKNNQPTKQTKTLRDVNPGSTQEGNLAYKGDLLEDIAVVQVNRKGDLL